MTYDMTYDSAVYLTVKQYAESAGISDRTAMRWLKAGELPGAKQDERGRWMIPAGATQTLGAGLVALTTEPPMYRPANIDELPSFLPLDAAAGLLGISRHAIDTHRDYFGVVPFGPYGSLVIPLATIKRIRG